MERQLGPIEQRLTAGDGASLRGWLAEQVWPLGRRVNGEALVQQVSGEVLSSAPFLRYLGAKLERLQAL